MAKVCLQIINMVMQIIFTFFSLFFTIYVYDLSQNLQFVLLYTIFSEVCFIIFETLAVRFLNAKNFNLFYRLSFLLIFVAILLVFLISSTTIYMVFVVQAVYALALVGYYLPQEVATMNYNNKTTITNFVGFSQILGIVAAVTSPLVSGFLIDKIPYVVFLTIIAALALVALGFSFGVKHGYVATPTIKITAFIKNAHQLPKVRQTYLSYGLYKFSQDSIVKVLIPILLFLRLGTNLSVGLFAALAALIGGVVIICYLIINHRWPNFASWALIVSTIILLVVTTMLTVWVSVISFFIYYFVSSCCSKVISQNITQNIFTVIEDTPCEPYKKEHHWLFNLYDHGSKLLAYLIALLIVSYWQSVIVLTVMILVVTCLQIISTTLLLKASR